MPNSSAITLSGYSPVEYFRTMSLENTEIIKRATAAFHRGDLEGAMDYYAPDVEWRDLQHAPDAPPVVHGIDAVERIWSDWLQAFPDLRADVLEYIAEGDAVVCVTHFRGTGDNSGAQFDHRQVDVFEIADGKIGQVTLGYESKDEALDAVRFAGSGK